MSDQRHQAPSQILYGYWLKICRQGKGQAASYALDVATLYNKLYADQARTLPFDLVSGAPAQIIDRCYKRIERWLDPAKDQHLPFDIVQALIDAMPDHLRQACWSDVLGSMGFLAAHKPEEMSSAHATFGELVDVFGKISQAAAPIMADGKIDEQDRPHAPAMLRKIDQMRGQLAAWEHALRTQALGE